MSVTDRIEKKVFLRAPRSRVWRAVTDAEEFGTWFRVKLEGPFVEGAAVRGRVTHPGYEHYGFEAWVERIEPERYFAYRWHPYPEPGQDHGSEPTTLVEFRLDEAEGGTLVTVSESGFDRIPAARREEAFRMNEGGWTEQAANLERHVSPA